MVQSVRGLREESGCYFPREFDANVDFACVCLEVIRSAGALAQLKLTVEVMSTFSRVLN